MLNRRFYMCMAGGFIAAVICISGAFALGFMKEISFNTASLVLNRILIGFVIGISFWKIHYLLHGALIGLLVSLVKTMSFLPQEPNGFLIVTITGVAYGMATEFVVTKVCREPVTNIKI